MSLHWRCPRELFVRECHVLSSRHDRGLGRIVCHRHGVGRVGRLRWLWVERGRSLRLSARAALRVRRLRRLRRACGDLCAAAVYAPPAFAPAPPPIAPAPIAVDHWDTGGWGRCGWGGCGGIGCGCGSCGCGRGLLYGLLAAPAPIYVVNQGPEYTGPGIMVPYHTYSPQAGFVAPYDYPYISGSGYGYGHRYGYGRYGVRLTAPRLRASLLPPYRSALCLWRARLYPSAPLRLRPDAVYGIAIPIRTARSRCGITNTIGQSVCEGPPARGPSFFSSPKSVRRRGSRCKVPAPRRSTR